MSFTIAQAHSADDLNSIKTLFQAYVVGLGLDISFQNFDHELASLPGKYAPPSGALLLAKSASTGEAIGCVGLRPLQPEGTCEMKRLYVSPKGRGTGVGRALAEAVVAEAKRLGYGRMVLDTLGSMTTPLKLYRGLGFRDIEPYYHNPLGDVIFLELALK
jgi:ribosomal protein S18 acetylase RimI-like enzyme